MNITNPVPPRRSAAQAIQRILLDVLPPEVPPQFRRVVNARFVGAQRIVADLEMIDGLPAQVEAWQWRQNGWAHRWLRLDGGDLSWENGIWMRFPSEPSTVTSVQ